MLYDAVVITNEGKHTYQNIEAKNEQHLTDKIQRNLKTEIVEIEIKNVLSLVKTFTNTTTKNMLPL